MPFPDFLEGEEQEQGYQDAYNTIPMVISSVPSILEQIDTMSKEERQIYTHVLSITEGMSHVLTIDGLHPTPQGHELLGKNLAEKLRNILGYCPSNGDHAAPHDPQRHVRT
jgi:lysophospholipase L1-like esterase